jgi:tRNA threonylcarbamoyladenosine biosynthesis protein TsaB
MTSPGLFRADLLLQQSRSTGPVLGLETGGPQASLAISSHGKIIATEVPPRRAHGESIVGAIDQMLRRCELRIRDLTAIAVGIGPGSFTGLRIALSYAKGVALATGCAVIGIASLDALALCALELPDQMAGAVLCPLLDARKKEVYAALYRQVENRLEKVAGEFLARPRDLAGLTGGPVVFFGDGAAAYGDLLREGASGARAVFADLNGAPPPAAMIAVLGASRAAHGQFDAVASLQPLYVRPSEAELKSKSTAVTAGLEALWSREKKSSSANTPTMTRS